MTDVDRNSFGDRIVAYCRGVQRVAPDDTRVSPSRRRALKVPRIAAAATLVAVALVTRNVWWALAKITFGPIAAGACASCQPRFDHEVTSADDGVEVRDRVDRRVVVTPVLEVYADIWCPFAHVGLPAVLDDHRRRSDRGDVVIRVRAWPLELVNSGPMDQAKRSHTPSTCASRSRQRCSRTLRPSHSRRPTLDALALVERAYAIDGQLGERASFEVRDAMFEGGRDISDHGVLTDLGGRWGVGEISDDDRALVVQSWHDGQVHGVRGSPHFFSGDLESFCPSLRIRRIDPDHGAQIELDARRLDEFLDACLDS